MVIDPVAVGRIGAATNGSNVAVGETKATETEVIVTVGTAIGWGVGVEEMTGEPVHAASVIIAKIKVISVMCLCLLIHPSYRRF
jgi:hypothetical protein